MKLFYSTAANFQTNGESPGRWKFTGERARLQLFPLCALTGYFIQPRIQDKVAAVKTETEFLTNLKRPLRAITVRAWLIHWTALPSERMMKY